MAIARRIGDPRTLATCLDARHYALWLPENVEERLEVAAELRRVAEETGDPELELQGAGWTIIDLMELGDIDGVDIQIAAASKLAEALHRPIWLWWTSLFRGARAQLAGDFDEAERLAQETLAIGQRGQAENALHYYAQAMFNIRREQGRLAEVEGAVRGFIELYPAIPAWRARAGAAAGRARAARTRRARSSRRSPRGGFAAFPRDANWLIAITLMAEVCGALGDAARAAELYALLEPYAGRNVVVGPQRDLQRLAPRGCSACWPPRAASTSWPSATSTRRRQMHAAMGARPWHARTQVVLRGDAAGAGAAPGDVERARGDARRRDPRRRRARDGRARRAARRAALVAGVPPERRVTARRWARRARPPISVRRRGEPVRRGARLRSDLTMARADHRLRLLRLRRRDAALDGPVPRLRRSGTRSRRRRAAKAAGARRARRRARRGGQAAAAAPTSRRRATRG